MKKNGILTLLAALLVIALLAGCGGGGGTTTTPPNTPPATTTPTTTPPPTASGSLSSLLGMSSKITSMKFDMLVTTPGVAPITSTVWVKNNKMRTEVSMQGITAVVLMDLDAKMMYSYMPSQNLAIKIPFDPGQVPQSPTDDAQSILGYNANVVGTETIDGKVCTVVEYTAEGQSVKAWIWQDKGFPVRMEMTTAAGKTIIEYKNIDLSDIPDSMFELPAGVQMMG